MSKKAKKILIILVAIAVFAIVILYVYQKYYLPIKQKTEPISQAQADEYYKLANEALGKGDLTTAKENFKQALRVGNNELYLEKYALISYQLNQFDQSIDSYTKLISIENDNASYWNSIGNVYRDSGKGEEAIKAYQKAIEIDKKYVVVYSNLANLYLLRNEKDKAQETIKEGLKNNPKDKNLLNIRENIH